MCTYILSMSICLFSAGISTLFCLLLMLEFLFNLIYMLSEKCDKKAWILPQKQEKVHSQHRSFGELKIQIKQHQFSGQEYCVQVPVPPFTFLAKLTLQNIHFEKACKTAAAAAVLTYGNSYTTQFNKGHKCSRIIQSHFSLWLPTHFL